jgi:glycosyltransferase involved in cell wall biosynthesis
MAYLAHQQAEGISFNPIESRGGGAAVWSGLYVVRAAWDIAAAARSGAQVVVHLNMAEGSSAWRKGLLLHLARLCGLKTVLHVHAADIISFYGGLPGVLRAALRATFRRADVCIVLGEAWRAWSCSVLGVNRFKIVVLRNGVPLPAVVRLPRAAAEFTFLFLGNLLPRKGLPDLIQALSLADFKGVCWRLLVVGGGNCDQPREQAVTLGLEGRISFTGWLGRAAVTQALATADALVLPSYHEALPLVLHEAAGLNVPIVTTPVGAIAELFTDGDTALFVTPGDRAGLAAALSRVLADAALRARLAANARALFDREFTMAAFTRHLCATYRTLLSQPAGLKS